MMNGERIQIILFILCVYSFLVTAFPALPSDHPNYIPTPDDDSHVPLPGQSGLYYHEPNNNVYMYLGDDKLEKHAQHLAMNQEQFPENRGPMALATQEQLRHNRKEALAGIPTRGGEGLVRDEKPLAMLLSKDHARTTTVQYLPEKESSEESKLAKKFSAMLGDKEDSNGVLVPNPRWLYFDRKQHIAHEAQASVPTRPHTTKDGQRVQAPNDRPQQEGPSSSSKPSKKRKGKRKGKTMDLGTIMDESGAIPGTNLVSSSMISKGHAWKPFSHGVGRASHFGAPSPYTDRESRDPPAVLDHEHFKNQKMKQANQKIVEEKLRKEGVLHKSRRPAEPLQMDVWPPAHPHALHPPSRPPSPLNPSNAVAKKADPGRKPGPSSAKHVPQPPSPLKGNPEPPEAGPSRRKGKGRAQDQNVKPSPNPTDNSGSQTGLTRKARARAHSQSSVKHVPYPPPWLSQGQNPTGGGSSHQDAQTSRSSLRGPSPSPPKAGSSLRKGKGRARSTSIEQQSSGKSSTKEETRGRSPGQSGEQRGPKYPTRERSPSASKGQPSSSKTQTRGRQPTRTKQDRTRSASSPRGKSQGPPKAGPSHPRRNTSRKPPSPDNGKQVSKPLTPSPMTGPPRPRRNPAKQENAVASGSNTNRPRTRAAAKNEAANRAPSPAKSRSKSPQPKPRTRSGKP